MLLFDLDGTLAPIVDVPAAARPAPGVTERLDALAARYRLVGAVSGRPVSFLAGLVPASLALSGLYGLESRVGGILADHPEADDWRTVVGLAEARAELEGPPEMTVEAKGLSITLHYRMAPEIGPEVEQLAARIGAELRLEVRSAKMSVELHPPIAVDKGTAVFELAEGARQVLYAGDDRGDLPAFAALDALAARSVTVLGIAIGSPELPFELRDRADLVLPGIDAVPALLDALLG